MTSPHATDRLGTVTVEDGRPVLRYERHMPHPPARVWRALTESEELQHWLPCDIVGDRREGAELRLPFWPDHVEAYELDEEPLPGRILVWQPPETFEWTWDTDRLRFELEPAGEGTVLRFTTWVGDPRGHGVDGSPDDATGTTSAAAGWHTCLDHLEVLLDGRPGRLAEAATHEVEARYRPRVDAALR